MKKLIFGCALMLYGAICGTGWLIARISLVQPGAWSSIHFGFDELETYVILVSYALAIAGALIAIKAIKEDK